MDAMIMHGETLEMGAVTGVEDIFHPITLARRVMEKTEFNFLGPKGANALAKREGFQILPKGALITPSRRTSLDNWLRNNNLTLLTDV
jgi:L-asparaginase / beta-aspartyl-peptidase